jgi:hypothetical protein
MNGHHKNLSSQKEKAFLGTNFWANMLSNTVSTLSTEIRLNAIPSMPWFNIFRKFSIRLEIIFQCFQYKTHLGLHRTWQQQMLCQAAVLLRQRLDFELPNLLESPCLGSKIRSNFLNHIESQILCHSWHMSLIFRCGTCCEVLKRAKLNKHITQLLISSWNLQQAMSRIEQLLEGTHKLLEPVSNTTVKGWGGVPIVIGP